MKYFNKISFLLILILLLATFVGCQSTFEQSETETKRIAIVLPQEPTENPFWQRIKEGAENAAKDLGIKLLIFSGSQYDIDKEIMAMEQAIKEQPDGLIISPARPDALVPVVEKAISNDIPVIVFDAPLNSNKVLTETRFDGIRGGALIGKFVLERLGGTGKILILDGGHDSVPGLERHQGFEHGFKTGNIEILDVKSANWQRDEAYSITTDWLKQFTQVDAILAANDDMALGAADAVIDSNRTGIIITGIDGNPNALQAIKEGHIHATVDQSPIGIGNQIVKLMGQYLKDNKPLPPNIKWQKTPLIHQQNVSQYLDVNVVHTGIKIFKIEDFNQNDFTIFFDFLLWFRYQSDIPDDIIPEEIVLQNVVEPFTLGKPTSIEEHSGSKYRAYRINGHFKINFLPSRPILNEHVIGITFQHKHIDRKQVIYTPDFLGMGFTKQQSLVDQLKNINIFSLGQNWIVSKAQIFEKTVQSNSLGRPYYLQQEGSNVTFSQFYLGIWIEAFSIRGKISTIVAIYLFFFCIIAQLLLYIYEKLRSQKRQIFIWSLRVILTIINLLSIEILIISYFVEHTTNYYYLKNVIYVFDILWWLIFSHLIVLAINNFIWLPLEQKSSQKIPNLARGSVSFIIYLLAIFGIVAFVFEQTLTGLLATSGVVAMIIGLAVQLNISNIFSGLALNIERSFRIGDKIKIIKFYEGGVDKGEVLDITWRTIKIRTENNDLLSIPNSVVAENLIHNLSYTTTGIYTLRILVHINSNHADNNIINILENAVLPVENILTEPKPKVIFQGINKTTANYLIKCFVNDYQAIEICTENIWKNIVTQMKKANIPFAK